MAHMRTCIHAWRGKEGKGGQRSVSVNIRQQMHGLISFQLTIITAQDVCKEDKQIRAEQGPAHPCKKNLLCHIKETRYGEKITYALHCPDTRRYKEIGVRSNVQIQGDLLRYALHCPDTRRYEEIGELSIVQIQGNLHRCALHCPDTRRYKEIGVRSIVQIQGELLRCVLHCPDTQRYKEIGVRSIVQIQGDMMRKER
eukprot:261980-Pelagomonas_calceolata.AAC.2